MCRILGQRNEQRDLSKKIFINGTLSDTLPRNCEKRGMAEFSKWFKSIQGDQGYSGNQKNVIHGQRPHMESRHTQQKTQSNKSK